MVSQSDFANPSQRIIHAKYVTQFNCGIRPSQNRLIINFGLITGDSSVHLNYET